MPWRNNFRHDTFRPGQEEAIDEIDKHFNDNHKYVIAEIPTGVGKSDIAMALAKTEGSAYVATSQNTLIDQYVKDFKDDKDFWYVKGRGNYKCPVYETCHKGSEAGCSRYEEQKDEFDKTDCEESYYGCKYKSNRNRAVSRAVALTNLTYFALGINTTRENAKWQKRQLAVIDEAHNLPTEVLNLTSMVITSKHLRGIFMSKTLPQFFDVGPIDVESPAFWDFIRYLEKFITQSIIQYETKSELEKALLSDLMDEIKSIEVKLRWFQKSFDDEVEWVGDLIEEGKIHKLVLRPLESDYFAQKMFFENQSERYLLQSATIINHKRYAKELGIVDYGYVEAESPFKLFKARPLFCMNTGKMGNNDIKSTLPQIAADIEKIMNAYKGKRGLVHTVNYSTIQSYLEKAFEGNPRCLFVNRFNRTEMLEKHESSTDTILFSPSLTEGFDGKGDLVRFQVICKIPYASLGDRRIKIKMERDNAWYRDEALKTLVQMVGRGVRSETDYCDNYILDSGFGYFCKQVNPPDSFLNTIIFNKEISDKRLLKMT